jgi:hypothetical protein
MKLDSIQEIINSDWISKCHKNTFGIILPNGWLGRPFDNRHILYKVEADSNFIKIIFDDIRSLTIYDPGDCEIFSNNDYSSLRFNKFTKIELEWVPYGDEGSIPPITKKYDYTIGSKLELVGYFI